MSEGASGGFASFLRSSVGKLSSEKGVKFLPPNTQSKGGDTVGSKSKSQKEHRRAQVRKAQIEHRQRKENYVKHLEQDVNRLRDMVSTVEKEASSIKSENISIKTTLSKFNISSDSIPSLNSQPQQNSSPSGFANSQAFSQGTPQTNFDFQSPQQSIWPSDSPSSDISITFDKILGASCLQVSPHGSFDHADVLDSPDIFNFPADTLSQLPNIAASSNKGLQKPLPHLPGQASSTPLQPDLSSIAINFILALENPCRTHFHAIPKVFDPTGDPTGHELMASTLLYSHAPESVFKNLDSAAWSAPSLELTQLWHMSQSLAKEDFEITPVQAWFLLSQNYEVGRVLKNMEGLKKGIGELVGCWAFGAVMDELKFWHVVKTVMGD